MNHGREYTLTSCPACRYNEIVELFKMSEHVLMQCQLCGHGFVRDVPSDEELFRWYENTCVQEREFVPRKRLARSLKYWLFGKYLKTLSPRGHSTRLLEIGCGQGDLLHAVRNDPDIEAEGIDYGAATTEYARSLGLRAYRQPLKDRRYPDNHFDIIVALHVIEHVQNLDEIAAEIRRILKPDGCFFAVVPCLSHIKARLAGTKWKYWGPPGHLWYFTTKSFRALLERFHFDVVYSSALYHRAHMRILAKKKKVAGTCVEKRRMAKVA